LAEAIDGGSLRARRGSQRVGAATAGEGQLRLAQGVTCGHGLGRELRLFPRDVVDRPRGPGWLAQSVDLLRLVAAALGTQPPRERLASVHEGLGRQAVKPVDLCSQVPLRGGHASGPYLYRPFTGGDRPAL